MRTGVDILIRDNDVTEIIDNTEEAVNDVNEFNGFYHVPLTDEHIEALLQGKLVIRGVNAGEYGVALSLENVS